MGGIKVHDGLLGILLGFIFLLLATGTAAAGSLDQLLTPLAPVTTTVNSLGLPIQLGTSSSGLPILPAIDPNALINQTTSTVNGLGLPLQLPETDLGLPTLPAIDVVQVVDTTVDQLNANGPLPVSVPNPIDLITQPTIPDLPGLPGQDPGPLPDINNLFGPPEINNLSSLTGGNQAGFLPSFVSLRAVGAFGGLNRSGNINLAPAGASNGAGNLDPLSTGLAMLPLLGVMCILLALAAYFKSAQHVWHARA